MLRFLAAHILPNGAHVTHWQCTKPYTEMPATADTAAANYTQADMILSLRYCHGSEDGVEEVEALSSFP